MPPPSHCPCRPEYGPGTTQRGSTRRIIRAGSAATVTTPVTTPVTTHVVTRVGAGVEQSGVGMLASPRVDQAIRLLHTQFCKNYHRNLPDIPMDGFFLALHHSQNVYLIHNFPWLNRRG